MVRLRSPTVDAQRILFLSSVNLRELAAKLFPFRPSALGCGSFSEGNPFCILHPVYKPKFI